MVDLTTTYLGLKLKNPLVASAAQPISEKVETVKRLEDAGIAAIVMYSLFEEQVIHESLELDHYLSNATDFSREVSSYYPQTGNFSLTPEAYIEAVNKTQKGRQDTCHRQHKRCLHWRLDQVRPKNRRGGRGCT